MKKNTWQKLSPAVDNDTPGIVPSDVKSGMIIATHYAGTATSLYHIRNDMTAAMMIANKDGVVVCIPEPIPREIWEAQITKNPGAFKIISKA